MPNQPRPENRHRMVRVEDELWTAAREAAEANGTTVSEVIRDALRRYVKRHRPRRLLRECRGCALRFQ